MNNSDYEETVGNPRYSVIHLQRNVATPYVDLLLTEVINDESWGKKVAAVLFGARTKKYLFTLTSDTVLIHYISPRRRFVYNTVGFQNQLCL